MKITNELLSRVNAFSKIIYIQCTGTEAGADSFIFVLSLAATGWIERMMPKRNTDK